MRKRKTEFMPVVDESGNLVDVIFWEDLFEDKLTEDREKIELPVVIMAGGKGTRLNEFSFSFFSKRRVH